MSMIERVARAIDPYAWSDKTMGMRRAVSLNTARAAIEAMREPTDEMGRIVRERVGFSDSDSYRRLIDAALHSDQTPE